MPFGPGRYDQLCTMVRELTNAEGAIVIVFNGVNGDGFSCQASPEATLVLPDVLENVAREIRKSMKGKMQ